MDERQQERRKVDQLSVAIQAIAKRMDAQFVLDDGKVESFVEANKLQESASASGPVNT